MPAYGYGMQKKPAQYGLAAGTAAQGAPPVAQTQQKQMGAAPTTQPTAAPITSNARGGIPGAGGSTGVTGSTSGGYAVNTQTPPAAQAGAFQTGKAPGIDPNAPLTKTQRNEAATAEVPWAVPVENEYAPPATQMDDWQQQWSDIYADYEKSLPEQFRQADLAAASQGRRQNELNSIMGGSGGLGGMYGSTMAQMGLTGQNLRMEAQAKHDKQGLEMKLGWLDQQIKLAEAQNNRALAAQLQEEQNKTQLAIAQAEAGMTPSPGGGTGAEPTGAEGDRYYDQEGSTASEYSPTTINEFNMNAGVRRKMPWEIREGDL